MLTEQFKPKPDNGRLFFFQLFCSILFCFCFFGIPVFWNQRRCQVFLNWIDFVFVLLKLWSDCRAYLVFIFLENLVLAGNLITDCFKKLEILPDCLSLHFLIWSVCYILGFEIDWRNVMIVEMKQSWSLTSFSLY